MRVFAAKVVYDSPRENDAKGEYDASISVAFCPEGAANEKSNYVYVNAKMGTQKEAELRSLKKGDSITLVEVQSGGRKPYYVVAELDPSLIGRMGGSADSGVTMPKHDTTLADAGQVDPKIIIDRGKMYVDVLNYMLNMLFPRLTSGTAASADEDAKPGLGMSPFEAVSLIKDMATSVYIETGKTHRRERF